ncbi:hypothetical protein ACN9J3_06110 [Aliarcobacter butzleri]|uniref:hypothetical protein n=1 Tax=Aliarcobacter butzleri TaxID=28197 RepID=UPI003B2235E3
MGGSALTAFVTVRVTQKFYGESLVKNEKHIEDLFKNKDEITKLITKLETEVDTLKRTSVTKDEVTILQQAIKHIENDISKLDIKLDKIMDIMIKGSK